MTAIRRSRGRNLSRRALAAARAPLWVLVLSLLAAAAALAACGGGGSQSEADLGAGGRTAAEGGAVYVALGDSFAAGVGASGPGRGYVERLRSMVAERMGEELRLINVAVPGATTESLVEGQLPSAEAVLRRADVRLVTIDIGGNDYAALFGDADCLQETVTPGCPLAAVLEPVEARLDEVLRRLRSAGPAVDIAVMAYPNIFSGSGHEFETPAENALSGLNRVIRDVAARHDVLVADPGTAFDGRSLELTHIGDDQPDFHPNDAGHAAIAEAFYDALFP